MDEILSYLDVFLLVFVRMGALLWMNPIFARKNVPMMARVGLVFSVSLLLAPLQDGAAVAALEPPDMVLAMIRELGIGLLMGMVFQVYYYMLYVAGDLMDTVFGLSMAKVMDPVSSVQASTWGQMLNMLFVLYFFATGSHLVMIKLFAYSYEVVPVGAYMILLPRVTAYLLTLFHSVFILAAKLALPFAAAEFILEAAMGILMKLIPQIHVFVINLQTKIAAGILLMMLFAQPLGEFIDRYVVSLMEDMQKVLTLF
ncbi:flagellar biosynthetic protein FliR [[Clostridium] symbiosum]|uniref:flagellar biosynthetic protein FliR n=1 Tax=Clostridium symbiosum TaxID=1512 RepID=UPI001D06D6AF|nr:flagellar biosynthetic protein FliR [[Clostridium] symbiosum]MCB6609817.1 flagellar biosynthetic protein FliR [[Clostridium] symbiosum]MCB6931227.1 flagellar biosynthetic protein FliR [[Clostridium] symbiosum]